MKASWNGNIIAESDDTVVVEWNHDFPADSVNQDCLTGSDHTSFCPWKGSASYYSLTVGDTSNTDAAWYYPNPMDAAKEIKGRIAFWHGVQILD